MFARRLLTAAALSLTLLGASACKYEDLLPHETPMSASLQREIKAKGMGVNAPILVRIYKEESELEVWKQKTDGSYDLLKKYEICAWSGKLGPKKVEGDRQAPEGFYTVTPAQLNPNSKFHLALNMGYPNTYDQANGRTGTHLMVHGSCSSSGCYAMDDAQIQEIYTMARYAFQGGQRAFQIQAYPFRMTPKNMARHRKSEHYEFWRMLKEGSDYFETTRKLPNVGVCEKRYIFDQSAETVARLSPGGACPTTSLGEMVAAKQTADDAEELRIAAAMTPTDFAQTAAYSYRTGDPISAEAYAAEQHRRPGYDRTGARVGGGSTRGVFSNFLGR